MPIRVERLTRDREEAYSALLARIPESLLFHGIPYRNFLCRVLPERSEERYLVALDGDEMLGALPAFLRRNARFGNVLNSLPFFGSNGGLLVAPCPDDRAAAVRDALLDAYREVERADDVVWSTIVSNPLAPQDDVYHSRLKPTFEDDRLGQLTRLPRVAGGSTDALREALMASFHQKTRNAIRKAARSELRVGVENTEEAIRGLADLHAQNMTAIGGAAKPWSVFQAIRESFREGVEFEVHVARVDGEIAAALLVFFHGSVCEYFTPATDVRFRSTQAGSLLIFEAMQRAVRRRCTFWNWGGTWRSQTGVLAFKARWGTESIPYRYYVREHRRSELRAETTSTILREYPYFYVFPFTGR